MNYNQLKTRSQYYQPLCIKAIRRHKQIVKETNMAQHSKGRKNLAKGMS